MFPCSSAVKNLVDFVSGLFSPLKYKASQLSLLNVFCFNFLKVSFFFSSLFLFEQFGTFLFFILFTFLTRIVPLQFVHIL